MKNLSFYEQQHVLRLLKQEGQVKYIFDEFVRKSGAILSKWKENSTGNVWIRNAALERQLENELVDLHARLLANINNHSTEAWKLANKKTDDLIAGFIKDLAVSEVQQRGMFSHNEKAMQAFLNQKIDGITVSGRVWEIANGAKTNLEFYLQSGLSVGRPAAMISQDVRQLLNNSDRRFRRIRDKNGKLIPSKPMENYHPGQGVYRSPYIKMLYVRQPHKLTWDITWPITSDGISLTLLWV